MGGCTAHRTALYTTLTLHTGDTGGSSLSSSGAVEVGIPATLLDGHLGTDAVSSTKNQIGSIWSARPVPSLLHRKTPADTVRLMLETSLWTSVHNLPDHDIEMPSLKWLSTHDHSKEGIYSVRQ